MLFSVVAMQADDIRCLPVTYLRVISRFNLFARPYFPLLCMQITINSLLQNILMCTTVKKEITYGWLKWFFLTVFLCPTQLFRSFKISSPRPWPVQSTSGDVCTYVWLCMCKIKVLFKKIDDKIFRPKILNVKKYVLNKIIIEQFLLK